MSALHLTPYNVPAYCADSQLVVSTVTECVGTSQYFSWSPVSFISMLFTCLSPAIQNTEDVYTGGNSEVCCDTAVHFIIPNYWLLKQQPASWYEITSITWVSYQTLQHWHFMRIQVFWNVMLLCWVSGFWHSRVELQGFWTVTAWSIKMEAPWSFEMLETTHNMPQCHIPKVLISQQHHCEKHKSHDDKLFSDIFDWHIWNWFPILLFTINSHYYNSQLIPLTTVQNQLPLILFTFPPFLEQTMP
jgi:hypothetical protein